jgi:type I restriction enzyme, R subunit
VKPLECVFFMRSVKSRTYFEQMKGRGVRVINDADFQAVTPDSPAKERYVIVDAVGVPESELVDTQPLDREPTVPLDKLLRQLSFGVRDPDALSKLAARLSRLDRRLGKDDREQLEQLSGGTSMKEIAGAIVAALDPDRQIEPARVATGTDAPRAEEIVAASRSLLDAAVEPLATNPELRERIIEVRRSYEQAIDETSPDTVIEAGYSRAAADRARNTVASWEQFVADNKDEITALQIVYSRPQAQRLTFREVKELAQTIGRPPHQWTPENLRAACKRCNYSAGRRLQAAGLILPRLIPNDQRVDALSDAAHTPES